MVPRSITRYLEEHHTPYKLRAHARAVTAQETAAAIHEPGDTVAKAVIVDADERRWIAMLPATELLDRSRLANELHAHQIRLVDEPEFARQFPDCELGAEPPFGGLYGLPVIADATLSRQPRVYLRAGSHEECVELAWSDFERLEHPHVAPIGSRADGSEAQRPLVGRA
jgi:Ala-tRNA(Pro) deacylase